MLLLLFVDVRSLCVWRSCDRYDIFVVWVGRRFIVSKFPLSKTICHSFSAYPPDRDEARSLECQRVGSQVVVARKGRTRLRQPEAK